MLYYPNIVRDDRTLAPLVDVYVSVLNPDGEKAALLDADGDPVDNPIVTNYLGDASFYIADAGIYTITYVYGGRTYRKDTDIIGIPSEFIGPPGPAFATFVTLAAFKAAPTSNLTQVLQDPTIIRGQFYWETANAPYVADNIDVIKADSTPLSVGAWVRTGSLSLKDGMTIYSPPALITEKIYLYQRLSKAKLADIGNQVGSLDISPELQVAIDDAQGNEVILPEDGLINLDTGVNYTPNYSIPGQMYPGLKLIGKQQTILRGPANGYAITMDTGVSFKFLDNNIFQNFVIDSNNRTGSGGIQMKRAYRVLLNRMILRNFKGDAFKVLVGVNDADSSNSIILTSTNITNAAGWAINHDPQPGQNDLSYLRIENCLINSCGTDERKAITNITTANPGVVTCPAHGFSNGQKLRIGGVFGMFGINTAYVFIVNNATTNTFELQYIDSGGSQVNFNTAGLGGYTSGGTAFPSVPNSGSIRMAPQIARLVDGAITESKNVGIMIGNPNSSALNVKIDEFSCENTVGISTLALGVSGLRIIDADLRANLSLVGPHYAHVLLDATERVIAGVVIDKPSIIQFNGGGSTNPADPNYSPALVPDCPVTAFQAVGGSDKLLDVTILRPRWDSFGTANQIDYGNGIFNASLPTVTDPQRKWNFLPLAAPFQSFTTANPIYTPDIRRGEVHLIELGVGSSGTLTVNTPTGVTGGNALDGHMLNVVITNNSTVSINLTWNIPTKSAPTTIAATAGTTLSGTWRFSRFSGWTQQTPWI